jgi:lipopolysaccharide/colanic/teichoic acid biosynthesis glycosyltransferase
MHPQQRPQYDLVHSVPWWKRSIDIFFGALALAVAAPIIVIAMLLVWLSDFRNPLFISTRIGLRGKPFRFIKIRTMVPNASANGVDTTIAGDPRITRAGKIIRAAKIDELPQFIHVLSGQMSLVGPRPNVPREVARYTDLEHQLLSVRPGITDYSSIIFADLGMALAGSKDANVAYEQLVRPWKSALGLHYIDTISFRCDLYLLFLTFAQTFARKWALSVVASLLRRSGAPIELCEIALRRGALAPDTPAGAARLPKHCR